MKRIAVVLIVLLASACARPAESVSAPGADRVQSEPARERPTLRLASQREPSMLNDALTTAIESSGGLGLIKQIANNQLMVLDDRFAWVPQLAAEPIAVERGTWRINPDNTMDTTWKLRPNVRWQDGTPFTSDDLLFAFQVYKDREIPNKIGAPLQAMESATAPDPLTFVVHWSVPYASANQAPGLEPLPRHLLEELYRTEKAQLTSSPLLRQDFVGLGAYRLTSWEPGSHLEFTPFDGYYLGHPPLGRVVVQIIPDANTIVSNILAGSLDAVTNLGLSMETGVEIRDRWQGTGNQVLFVTSTAPLWIIIQHRTEFARPANGVTSRTVRQALLVGLDRDAMSELFSTGREFVADSWVPPSDEQRSQLAGAIPQYPYSTARAQQVLAEAGWVRGPDGVLVHQAGREAFRLETRFAPEDERLMTIAAEQWKALGVEPNLVLETAALKANTEWRATFTGVSGASRGISSLTRHLHTNFRATRENGWVGTLHGYSNPKVDALMERLDATFDVGSRLAVHRELLHEAMEDVAAMPTVWDVRPVLAVKGVGGIKGDGAWNFHEWTKQS